VPTEQLLIVCLAVLAALAIVGFVRYRVRDAELVAEGSHAERAARERADVRRLELERAPAPVPAGPAEGSKVAIHVAGRDVQGTRVRVDDPTAAGWIVVDDAAFVTGDRNQPLGGAQWFREGPGMWIQEL